MSILHTVKQLEALYGKPNAVSIAKEIDYVSPHYRAMIEVSPFAVLATVGPEGLDCSPRDNVAGFVRIHDSRTLMLPDRRGNNRIDSLRSIVRDPRVALKCGATRFARINPNRWANSGRTNRESRGWRQLRQDLAGAGETSDVVSVNLNLHTRDIGRCAPMFARLFIRVRELNQSGF